MLRQLLKDSVLYGVGDFIFKVISFALFPIYTYTFSVEDFGTMELLNTLVSLIGIVANLGMRNSVARFYYDASDKEKKLFVSAGMWVVLYSNLLIVTLTLIGGYYTQELLALYGVSYVIFLAAILSIPFRQIVQYSLDILVINFLPISYSVINSLNSLGGILLGLVFIVYYQQGILGSFIGHLLFVIVLVPFSLWSIRKYVGTFDKSIAKKMFAFGYPYTFAGLAFWLFASVDRWLLGTLSDATNLGFYSIAAKFSMIIYFVNSAFGQAWSPWAVRLVSENTNHRHIIGRLFTLWFFLISVLGFGMSLFSFELLYFTSPSSYWGATQTTAIILLATTVSGVSQFTPFGINISLKTKYISYIHWFATFVNVLLNIWFIPIWGALGAAVATLFSYVLLNGALLYFSQKFYPIYLEKYKLLYLVMLHLIVFVGCIAFSQHQWSYSWIVYKILFILAVCLGAFFVKIIDTKEVTYWLKNFKS